MKLLIAVPALNEEQSIASVVDACLAAREPIRHASPITEVAITVVSDGSTDATAAIARERGPGVEVIEFPRNRGYGAAISEAWRRSDAGVLAFLDADGTCDPRHFAPLCALLIDGRYDMVSGCRMTPASRMPAVRRLGNRLFALMLRSLAGTPVRDVASGMRVVRRECLPRLYPLPKGLDFTPAMTARALLARDLKVGEVDMPYAERQGRSKLNVLRDGLRFFSVILRTALLYRPTRVLGLGALALAAVTAAMMVEPGWFYLRHGRLEEWMIYRFLVGELLATIAILAWCVAYLGRKAADITLSPDPARERHGGTLAALFGARWFWLLPTALVVLGVVLVHQGLADFLTTGRVVTHWSRFVSMMFSLSAAATLALTRVVDHGLDLLARRVAHVRDAERGQTFHTY